MDRISLRELRRKAKRFDELEKAVSELQERYRALESIFPDPLMVCDSCGKIEYVNARFEETFGWSTDELRGKVVPYVSRFQRAEHVKRLREVAAGREPPFRFNGLCKDGTGMNCTVHVSLSGGEQDIQACYLTVLKFAESGGEHSEDPRSQQGESSIETVSDQSSDEPSMAGEEDKARHPREESCDPDRDEASFEQFFCKNNVGMMVVDLDTGATCLNQSMVRIIDYSVSQAFAADKGVSYSSIREIAVGKTLWELIEKGRGSSRVEIELIRDDGEGTPAIANVFVVRERPGGLPVMGVTVIDVTKGCETRDPLRDRNAGSVTLLRDSEGDLKRITGDSKRTRQKPARSREDMSEVSQAMKLLVSKIAEQKRELQESIGNNLGITVYPLLDHLKTMNLSEGQQHVVETLDFNLRHIASSFGVDLSDRKLRLSAREIEVCRMIRSGKDSGQIAEAFGLARQTVVVHRKNIRKKLGLKKNKQNLAAYLKEHL